MCTYSSWIRPYLADTHWTTLTVNCRVCTYCMYCTTYYCIIQEWYVNLNKPNDKNTPSSSTATTKMQEETSNCNSSRSDAEDFVSASDCTGTPPSRSSSYHTPSEGEATSNSPWWELDTTIDAETTMDSSKCLQLTDESQQVFKMVNTCPVDVYTLPN